MEHLRLSDGEWKLMKTLWQRQPRTLAELVAALDAETGWSRATIFMMLKRLIAKGAVTMDDSGRFQQYSAAITYSDVEPEETEAFLSNVYGGSVGMMVSNLVDRGTLSEQDIQELKAILDAAERSARNEKMDSPFDALYQPPFIGLPENAGGPAWNAAGGSAMGRRTSGRAAFL